MNSEQMKEIAAKVPTTPDELAECLVPEHFQEEYGDRLLKCINAYIEYGNLYEVIAKRPRSVSVESSRKMVKYDWNDPFSFDCHFGMEDNSASKPYTNRGRTDAVWKTLQAYGFKKFAKNEQIGCDELIPSACFESFVRKSVKTPSKILEDGQIVGYEIKELANRIRLQGVAHVKEEDQTAFEEEEDMELVTRALSDKGLQRPSVYYTDLYYSFCGAREGLEQSTCSWHCRSCGECEDWRVWHCKGCNTCKYGASTSPCDKCNPEEYASMVRHFQL